MTNDGRSPVLERLALPDPVSAVLRPSVGPRAEVRRAQVRDWTLVTSRLDAARRRRTIAKLAIPLLGATCVVTALLAGPRLFIGHGSPVSTSPNSAPSPARSASATAPAPDLRLVDGSEFVRLAGVAVPRATGDYGRAGFEDGSSLTALTADTIVERLAMTEREVTLRLASGGVEVAVAKGGPRKWTVEAGELNVEVVGTRFVVRRSPERASVSVAEGVVLVRSPRLEDGVQRLVAGASVEIGAKPPPRRSAPPSLDALLDKADAARQSGDLHAAAAHLEQLVRTFPNDARTGIAAFQLALVTQQLGASPPRVVAAFETALAKARGQSLRQDCYWRLVLAMEHAGQTQRARQRAEQSLRDYPNGRYASELRRRVTPGATVPPSTVPPSTVPASTVP